MYLDNLTLGGLLAIVAVLAAVFGLCKKFSCRLNGGA